MPDARNAAEARLGLIPNFCTTRALLNVAFMMELVAIVLSLAGPAADPILFARFVVLSLYLQWIGLSSAMVLCWIRRWLRMERPGMVIFACWGVMLVVVAVVADIGWNVAHEFLDTRFLSGEAEFAFVMRNVCLAAILGMLLLRYFWAQHQWRLQVQAEGEARYMALHARIRPHFLFNSLNSLAALIPTKPAAAETMVEDLADLFRVALEGRNRLVPLREELDLVRTYLRIEQTRLGPRLGADWDVPDDLMDVPVPLLSLQPLVENAVHHGAAKIAGPATIRLQVRRDDDCVELVVDNPLPPDDQPGHRGSKVAVDNIAQRLRLIYGGRAELVLSREEGLFRARMRLPVGNAPDSPPTTHNT